MSAIVITGGRVIDATAERVADVLIADGAVTAVGADVAAPADATVLDAAGCVVSPGFVDLHTHLREPGHEEAETIAREAKDIVVLPVVPDSPPAYDATADEKERKELAKRKRGRSNMSPVSTSVLAFVGLTGVLLAFAYSDQVRDAVSKTWRDWSRS